MLRFVIIAVVALAVLVALRLVRLSFKVNSVKKATRKQEAVGQVIEMPSRERLPVTIQEFGFANFPENETPRDLEDFFERMFVKVGRSGGTDIQMYTLHVTTSRGLQRAVESETFRFGRDLLIVERFDRQLIRAALEKHLYELPQLARQID